MGTASFSVGNAASVGGGGIMLASPVSTSGAHTTSTIASNLDDGSGDISMTQGQVLQVHADEAMRVRFGGTAATTTTGHYIPAGEQREFYCTEAGTVSAADVA